MRASPEGLSVVGFAIAFGSALWVLTRPQLTRAARNTAVVCLGITPDSDVACLQPADVHRLRRAAAHAHPGRHHLLAPALRGQPDYSEVSPQLPRAWRRLTVLLHQTRRCPTMAVGLDRRASLCRLDAGDRALRCRRATDRRRTGPAAWRWPPTRVSPQFVFFNSQFSYQTHGSATGAGGGEPAGAGRGTADCPLPACSCGATVCLFGGRRDPPRDELPHRGVPGAVDAGRDRTVAGYGSLYGALRRGGLGPGVGDGAVVSCSRTTSVRSSTTSPPSWEAGCGASRSRTRQERCRRCGSDLLLLLLRLGADVGGAGAGGATPSVGGAEGLSAPGAPDRMRWLPSLLLLFHGLVAAGSPGRPGGAQGRGDLRPVQQLPVPAVQPAGGPLRVRGSGGMNPASTHLDTGGNHRHAVPWPSCWPP